MVFDYAEDDPYRVALARKDAGGQWRDVTSGEFRDQVLALARGLIAHGVRFGDRVALMSRTRYEWTLFDFALWTVGAQSVPVYPTSSAEQVLWMLHDAEVVAVMVEHEDHAMTVGSVIDRLPLLKRLWQLDAGALDELLAAGADIDDEVVQRHRRAVTPDSVATVIYTSGTTGRPKGCVITHASLMFESDTMVTRWEPVFHSKPGDEAATLLFLPLAHVFGRMVEIAAVRGRVKLGHQPELSARALMPDLLTFRPTFILAVPYIFEKVFNGARRTAEAEGRAGPFDKAVDIAVKYAEALEQKAFGVGPGPSAGLRMQHQFFDKVVYKKVRDAMGGRMRHAMSGGSGMDRLTRAVLRGRGRGRLRGVRADRDECGGDGEPSRAHPVRDGRPPGPGHVRAHRGRRRGVGERPERVLRLSGRPGGHPGGAARGLAGDRGPRVAGRRRLSDDHRTEEGDPGDVRWQERLPGLGLEERVRAHPLVAQCIVVGNDRPYIAALVTVDQESVDHWLAMQGRAPLSPAELVRDPDLEMEVRRAVVAANTAVSQAESIRTFRILAHPFSEELGLLTPSLKLKRKAIETAYAIEVDALYH